MSGMDKFFRLSRDFLKILYYMINFLQLTITAVADHLEFAYN
jgi:hypothetical protein